MILKVFLALRVINTSKSTFLTNGFSVSNALLKYLDVKYLKLF
jgi:hypothetical protein